MINAQQIISMIRGGQNPQQVLLNILQQRVQNNNNPIDANLLQLAKENKTQEIEQVARNIYKERGLDFDKEFSAFQQMLGLKIK